MTLAPTAAPTSWDNKAFPPAVSSQVISLGTIIGIAAGGGVVLIAVIVFAVWYFYVRGDPAEQKSHSEN